MRRLGQLIATIKDESLLYVDDCSHNMTYKLYHDKNGYKIAFRHSWRSCWRYDPDDGEQRVYGGAPGGPIPPPQPEVEERVVDCDFDEIHPAVQKFFEAKISLAPDEIVPIDDISGFLVMKVGHGDSHATYRWLRGAPPAGWEALDEFAEAILTEYREASEYEDKRKRLDKEVKERMVKSFGAKVKPERGLIQAGFVHETKWLLELFGKYQWSGRMTSSDTAAFQLQDVGNIELLDVSSYCDNYPYFKMTLQANWQQYNLNHKVSYLAVRGGARVSIAKDEILKLIPDAFPIDVLNDGSDMSSLTKECFQEILGDAEVELWVTDPRIAYAAYVSLVDRKRLIDRILDRMPTIEEARKIIGYYHLEQPRLLEGLAPGDPYPAFQRLHDDACRLKHRFLPEMLKKIAEEFDAGKTGEDRRARR